MSDTTPEPEALAEPAASEQPDPLVALTEKVSALEANLSALASENAALKAKADATAETVTATAADQGAERLVAELMGATGGPVRLAAKDERGKKLVRDTVAELGYDAAKTDLEGRLAILGKGTGMVATGQASGAAPAPAKRHRFDSIGPEKWGSSADPRMRAYGEKIQWIERTEASTGQKFRTAHEAFTKAEAALSTNRAA